MVKNGTAFMLILITLFGVMRVYNSVCNIENKLDRVIDYTNLNEVVAE